MTHTMALALAMTLALAAGTPAAHAAAEAPRTAADGTLPPARSPQEAASTPGGTAPGGAPRWRLPAPRSAQRAACAKDGESCASKDARCCPGLVCVGGRNSFCAPAI